MVTLVDNANSEVHGSTIRPQDIAMQFDRESGRLPPKGPGQ